MKKRGVTDYYAIRTSPRDLNVIHQVCLSCYERNICHVLTLRSATSLVRLSRQLHTAASSASSQLHVFEKETLHLWYIIKNNDKCIS